VRRVKQPRFRVTSVSECAALEAEQLCFQKRLRNCCAAYIDEWAISPGTGPVDESGKQSLTGAGLALQQDWRQAIRALRPSNDLFRKVAHGCYGRTRTE
jgi:hypothetical protein